MARDHNPDPRHTIEEGTLPGLVGEYRRDGGVSMNFPETALISFLYAVINTPAVGGIVVGILTGGIVLTVGITLRWIILGGQTDELEVYAYPTSALHSHGNEETTGL
jgi:hypothetical protein